MNSLHRLKTSILLLVFVGLAVYFASLVNGFILGDDTDQVAENVQIRSLANIPSFFTGSTYFREESSRAFGLYYKPVMMIVFTFIYSVFGADPLFYHLIQIVLFLMTGVFVLILFRHFFSPALSWFLAALFVVHPANAESVLFVSALQDVLYMFFGLIAVLFLLKHRRSGGLSFFAIVGFTLLLSLFSKETGVIFLVLSSVITAMVNKDKLPGAIMLAGFLFLLYCFFRFGIANIGFGEQAIARISQASFAERLMNMPYLIVTFFLLFIFPWHLEIHQNWLVKTFTFTQVGIPLVILLSLSVVWMLLRREIQKHNRKLQIPFYLFSVWIVAGILPHIHVIPLDVTFAERWVIAPIVGLLGMCGVMFAVSAKYLQQTRIVTVLSIVLLLVFAARTVVRSFDWRDSETLFVHDLRTADDNYYLENLYASLLLQEGKADLAEPYVKSSLESYAFLSNLSNMAIIHLKKGNISEAEKYFELSLEKEYIYPAVQNYVNFLVFIKKDYVTSKRVIDKYIPEYPRAGSLWMTLALTEHGLGKNREASEAAEKALSLGRTPIAEEVKNALTQGREPDLEKYLAE